MMKPNILPSLALSALVMAMSATSANAALFPELDAQGAQFLKNMGKFFGGKQNSQLKVYAVSKGKGKYGEILAQKGWKLDYTDNLSTIPNSPSTIVYVNVADAQTRWAALADFFANFNGVIVIDSNQTAEKSTDQESADTVTLTGEGLELAEGYRQLLAKSTKINGKIAPVATAVIVGMSSGRVFPMDIDADQNINGTKHSAGVIDLKDYVYMNANTPVQAKKTSSASRSSSDTNSASADFKFGFDLVEEKDGVHTVAQLYLDPYYLIDGGGSGKRTWYTDTFVNTGDYQNKCQIGRLKCGIYPDSNTSLVSVVDDPRDGSKKVTSYFVKHEAFVIAHNAIDAPSHFPDKDYWGKKEVLENDQKEERYNVGASFGVDFAFKGGRISIPAVLKGSAGFSVPILKIYPSWKGSGGVVTLNPTKVEGVSVNGRKDIMVVSGVELLSQFKTETNGVAVTHGSFEERYLGNIINGSQDNVGGRIRDRIQYCGDGLDQGRKGVERQLTRPSMAWVGWLPSLLVNNRFKENSIDVVDLVLKRPQTIKVTAGLIWTRATSVYWPTQVYCQRTFKGSMYPAYLKMPTNQPYEIGQSNQAPKVHWAGRQFRISHSYFKDSE
jgi:hypothetical protein